jgi:hypothetical protein
MIIDGKKTLHKCRFEKKLFGAAKNKDSREMKYAVSWILSLLMYV